MKTREQNLFCDSRHGHAGRAVAGVETTGSRLGVVGWLLVVVGVVVLVGCGDADDPTVEPLLSSQPASDDGVNDSEGGVAGEVFDDVDDDATVDDDDDVDGVDVGGGVVVVDDRDRGGAGGLLVVGLCGWPGPLCPKDEGVAALEEGGRLWFRERSKWEPWVGRVLDMCDDHEALTAIDGEYWTGRSSGVWIGRGQGIDYEAQIPLYDMEDIVEEREFFPIVCSEEDAATPHWICFGGGLSAVEAYLEGFEVPPDSSEVLAWAESEGLNCYDLAAERQRYVYVTVDGPMFPPQASVEAAVEAYKEKRSSLGAWAARDTALGQLAGPWEFTSPEEMLVVLPDTVSVVDGVVRGLAQNRSERNWARNATVTATGAAGREGVWRYALAVQPGEVMPFEIEGLTDTEGLSEISFEISADLSPTIDLSRSLDFTWWNHRDSNKETFLERFPEEIVAGGLPNGAFSFRTVRIHRQAPTAHPRLAEAALEQTIENLTVYAATYNLNGTIDDVMELTPMTLGNLWEEIRTIPTAQPDYLPITGATVVMIIDNTIPMIWAGGALPNTQSTSE